jgi:hypothetical protein
MYCTVLSFGKGQRGWPRFIWAAFGKIIIAFLIALIVAIGGADPMREVYPA